MIARIAFIILMSLSMISCQAQTNINANPVHIERFDRSLFNYVSHPDSIKERELLSNYPEMLAMIGRGIFNIQNPSVKEYFPKLVTYYSEPTLNKLYSDAINKYSDISSIEMEVGKGFSELISMFPGKKMPQFNMHVSGFNQNIIVGDSTISISIDKYLGKDYSLYKDFFYDYQRRKMDSIYIPLDYAAGWLMTEFPFQGKENVLLDRMIYEGKIKYIIHKIYPNIPESILFGYTENEYKWCEENEGKIWTTIIERKQLFTPDMLTTDKYFEESPSSFLSDNAPGNIGAWLGYQIINNYMKETNVSPEILMNNTHYQEILSLSKYKP